MAPLRKKMIELLPSRSPKFIDLGIEFAFSRPSSEYYENNVITVGTLFPQWPPERVWARQSNNLFAELIPMVRRGCPEFKAWIKRTKKIGTQANFVSEDSETYVCLVRAPADPPFDPSSLLKCSEGAKCQRMARDAGWLVFCDGYEDAALWPNRSPLPWPIRFISRAHAQDNNGGTRWSVPSLDVLKQRRRNKELVGTGFTEFKIASTSQVPNTVDAFYVDISINGQNVRFDGLRPQLLSSPIPADRKIQFDFGLENLNFSGAVGGCDEISAKLQFLSKGEPVGETLELNRFYVALRDAELQTLTAGDMTFQWTGKYRRPEPSYDHEVFVQSIIVSSLEDRDEVSKARHEMTRLLNKANKTVRTTHRDRPVAFVVRPPLSKPQDTTEKKGFGLAAAIVEPTGWQVLKSLRDRYPHLRHVFADAAYAGPKLVAALEDIGTWTLEIIRRSDTAQGFEVLPRRWVVEIRFTFEKDDAFALRKHLTQLGHSRFVIDPGSFVYTVNKDFPNPPGICSEL